MVTTETRPEANGWHFEKRISIDTMIGVAVIAITIGGPMVVVWNTMDKRVTIQETLRDEDAKKQLAREVEAREQRMLENNRAEKITASIQAMQIDIAKLITIQTQAKR